MLTLATHWIWDFWLADTGTAYPLFFLQAPREVHPDQRHWHTSVGHAISTDLTEWQVVGDALTPSTEPAFDDLAVWTGSVVRGDDGSWYLFYTGLSRADDGQVQRVGLATSADLMTWRKHGPDPLVSADPLWYHQYDGSGEAEAWRDPWLVRDPEGDGWHMLVTATARDGKVGERGVLGHVVTGSADVARAAAAQPAGFGIQPARGAAVGSRRRGPGPAVQLTGSPAV